MQGSCVCDFPYVSYDCGVQAQPLLFDALTTVWTTTGRVESEGYAWYFFTLPADLATGLQLTVERVGLVGDPDVYLSYNQWPTLLTHDYANTQCDSCPGTISSPLYLPPHLPAGVLPPAAARLLLRYGVVRGGGEWARGGAYGGVGVEGTDRRLRTLCRGWGRSVGGAVGVEEEGVVEGEEGRAGEGDEGEDPGASRWPQSASA